MRPDSSSTPPPRGFKEGAQSTLPSGKRLRRLASGSLAVSGVALLFKKVNDFVIWMGEIGEGIKYFDWIRNRFPGFGGADPETARTASERVGDGSSFSPADGTPLTPNVVPPAPDPTSLATQLGSLAGSAVNLGAIIAAVAVPVAVVATVIRSDPPPADPVTDVVASATPTSLVRQLVEVQPTITSTRAIVIDPIRGATVEVVDTPTTVTETIRITVTATARPTSAVAITAAPTGSTPTPTASATPGIARGTVIVTIAPTRTPTPEATATIAPTLEPTAEPTATETPEPTTPTYDPRVKVCSVIERSVPADLIDRARRDPATVGGWEQRCNPNAPPGPMNGLRYSLNLVDNNKDYHPTFNGLTFKCGCQ